MIRNEDNPENPVLPFLISPLTEPRGQIELSQKLIANLFNNKALSAVQFVIFGRANKASEQAFRAQFQRFTVAYSYRILIFHSSNKHFEIF